MKTKKRTSVLTSVLICVMLLVCSVSVSRGAERTGSIEMVYELSEVPFRLYRVALITESGVVPVEEYKRYHVDLNSENAAQTLAAYIQRDGIPALRRDTTDSSGSPYCLMQKIRMKSGGYNQILLCCRPSEKSAYAKIFNEINFS